MSPPHDNADLEVSTLSVDTATARRLDEANLPWLDVEGDEYIKDAHAVLRVLRLSGKLARSQRGIEILSYDGLSEMLLDNRLQTPTTDFFTKKGAGPVAREFYSEGMLIHMEPRRHLQHRRVFVSAFTRTKVSQQLDEMEQIANGLVDDFISRGRCEVITDYSDHIAIRVNCRALGIPLKDIPKFAAASVQLHWLLAHDIRPGAEELDNALMVMRDYVSELIALRREEPGEDFVSAVIAAQKEEGKLTDLELTWGFANLIFAGHDTTRYQLAAIFYELLQAGVWEEIAADTERLSLLAVNEGMRLHPIVQYRTRVNTEEVEVHGVVLPVGTPIAFNWLAAMRDPDAFDAPDTFRLHRDIPKRRDFGAGKHRCIGAGLAESEMTVAVSVLTRRLANPSLLAPIEDRPFNTGIGGPQEVSIAFTPR
jgi:cytochrome P450